MTDWLLSVCHTTPSPGRNRFKKELKKRKVPLDEYAVSGECVCVCCVCVMCLCDLCVCVCSRGWRIMQLCSRGGITQACSGARGGCHTRLTTRRDT
jgi:hypothetical protein